MIQNFIRWFIEEKATALMESAMLFPVLMSLMMGVYDLGQGVVINQKALSASQVMGDLITRFQSVDMATVDDVVEAGLMALEPYSTTSFGYDIVSVQFDGNGDPVVQWRVTDNMPPNDDAVNSTIGLGNSGEGLLIVTTNYTYQPFFAHFVVEQIDLSEVAFLRGRITSMVSCDDCPLG